MKTELIKVVKMLYDIFVNGGRHVYTMAAGFSLDDIDDVVSAMCEEAGELGLNIPSCEDVDGWNGKEKQKEAEQRLYLFTDEIPSKCKSVNELLDAYQKAGFIYYYSIEPVIE